jgi:hypothetical protein
MDGKPLGVLFSFVVEFLKGSDEPFFVTFVVSRLLGNDLLFVLAVVSCLGGSQPLFVLLPVLSSIKSKLRFIFPKPSPTAGGCL